MSVTLLPHGGYVSPAALLPFQTFRFLPHTNHMCTSCRLHFYLVWASSRPWQSCPLILVFFCFTSVSVNTTYHLITLPRFSPHAEFVLLILRVAFILLTSCRIRFACLVSASFCLSRVELRFTYLVSVTLVPRVGYVSLPALLPAQMTAGCSSLTRGLRLEKAA